MANVAEPQRDEVAAHHADLGRGAEDGEADEGQEQVGVAELQGQDDAARGGDGARPLFRNLLRGEPDGVADGADKARQPGPVELAIVGAGRVPAAAHSDRGSTRVKTTRGRGGSDDAMIKAQRLGSHQGL